MPTTQCRHIKTNGIRCGSPSLSGNAWCYFHNRLYRRHRTDDHAEATRDDLTRAAHLKLKALEDPASIKLALAMVLKALANNTIDNKRGGAFLYGLQIASTNAAKLQSRSKTSKNHDIIDAV
jgi:hypothetical protein